MSIHEGNNVVILVPYKRQKSHVQRMAAVQHICTGAGLTKHDGQPAQEHARSIAFLFVNPAFSRARVERIRQKSDNNREPAKKEQAS